MFEQIQQQTLQAFSQLIDVAKLNKGSVLVVGCSTSEAGGGVIGKNSSMEIARAIFDGMYPLITERGIFLACQCCEHLNRALVIEQELAEILRLEIVNAVPQPKAGGSFAATAYNTFKQPVLVEKIKADAGIDIGGTLIGMHLKETAIPLRLDTKKIGQAYISAARTRAKFIGGSRTAYNEDLL